MKWAYFSYYSVWSTCCMDPFASKYLNRSWHLMLKTKWPQTHQRAASWWKTNKNQLIQSKTCGIASKKWHFWGKAKKQRGRECLILSRNTCSQVSEVGRLRATQMWGCSQEPFRLRLYNSTLFMWFKGMLIFFQFIIIIDNNMFLHILIYNIIRCMAISWHKPGVGA